MNVRIFLVRFKGGSYYPESLTASGAQQLARTLSMNGSPASVIPLRIERQELNRLRIGSHRLTVERQRAS